MSTDMVDTLGVPRSHARRSRQLLLGCVVGSLTLHWVLLAVLPESTRGTPSLPAQVLSVVLVKADAPQAVPMAPPETKRPVELLERGRPNSLAKPVQKAEPPRIPKHTNAQPEPRAAAESAFTLPAQPPEPRPSASESHPPAAASAPTAAAPATPPVFNAGYLRNPPPVYPLIARRNGEQGTVTVKVLVTRDGTPARVSVERTSGSAHLDRAALDTVKTWRFVPAREGSEPVEAWVLVPIVFRLEGAS